jgi:hypothetical protein
MFKIEFQKKEGTAFVKEIISECLRQNSEIAAKSSEKNKI